MRAKPKYKGDDRVTLYGHSMYSCHHMTIKSKKDDERVYTIDNDYIFSRPIGEQNHLQAIDFDGGPMIYIGDILESSDGKEQFYLSSIVFNDDKFYELRFQKK